MTSTSDDHVIKKSVKIYHTDEDNDARKRLGTEAIEQLASGLNLAAHTIQEYSQDTIDDENLKQLNDEQLILLLEEAYISKKLDEKNKSAIFKEILEDVHESLATPDNNAKETANVKSSCSNFIKTSPTKKAFKHAATFDSIAALTEIMDPSSHITIPASGVSRPDPDADSSSTKTEVEEMELDQLSDVEDNSNKKLDENGNPSVTSSSGSVSFATRQLKPLSIYRHNPAFHSQHVSVNQMDEIPSLSPTSLQPSSQIPSTSGNKDDPKCPNSSSSKARRKKKAVKPEESIKAEEIDGYRGGDDLESLLQFIESNPDTKSSKSKESKTIQQTASDPSAQKSKRSRRADRKSKRSRTPSITTSSKEKSPEVQSQSQSRASSACASSKIPANSIDPVVDNLDPPELSSTPDSVITVKHSLIVVNNNPSNPASSNNNNKKTMKKPKKQAGWLVDLNNESGKVRLKSKPPTGKSVPPDSSNPAQLVEKKDSTEPDPEQEVEPETELEAEPETETERNDDSSEEPSSVQDEVVMLEDSPDEDKPVLNEVKETSNKIKQQEELCFNYASILKFVKREWNVVTKEISNGSNDIQSKVVYYKAREKI